MSSYTDHVNKSTGWRDVRIKRLKRDFFKKLAPHSDIVKKNTEAHNILDQLSLVLTPLHARPTVNSNFYFVDHSWIVELATIIADYRKTAYMSLIPNTKTTKIFFKELSKEHNLIVRWIPTIHAKYSNIIIWKNGHENGSRLFEYIKTTHATKIIPNSHTVILGKLLGYSDEDIEFFQTKRTHMEWREKLKNDDLVIIE